MNFPNTYGQTFLSIGFIVWGLSMIAGFALPPLALGIWMLVTGILLLIGR